MKTQTKTRTTTNTKLAVATAALFIAGSVAFAVAPDMRSFNLPFAQRPGIVSLNSVGQTCTNASVCLSSVCLNNFCARGSAPEGHPCASPGADDECDYGLFCSPSRVCQKKILDGSACSSSVACVSGICTNGTCIPGNAYSICPIVNNDNPQGYIDDAYVQSVVAVASDVMYERTGKRFTLQLPIAREKGSTAITQILSGGDVFAISALYRTWNRNDCFTARQNNPSNGILVYGGDSFLLSSSADAFTITSDDLSSSGYVSSHPNPHWGTTRIVGGALKKVNVKQDGVSIAHEILHQFDADAGNVHIDQQACADILGSRFHESLILGDTYSLIGWTSICPYTLHNFEYEESQVAPGKKLIGQRCAAGSECQSGLCDSPTGSSVPQIPGPYRMCMPKNLQVGNFCLSNTECQGGVCLALRCQESVPTGTQLPDASLCTSDGQCVSGSCIGARCFTKLNFGARCSDPAECITGICSNYSCSPPVGLGTACSSTHPCSPGLACYNQSCVWGNLPEQSGCFITEQCQTGLQCVGDVWNHECLSLCDSHGQCPTGEQCGQVGTMSFCLQVNVPSGRRCHQNFQCRSGVCDQTTRCT